MNDVERANEGVLTAWESVLDHLESMLDEPWNRSASALKQDVPRWAAAVHAASEASQRLNAGAKLAEARYRDARRAGLSVNQNRNITDRARVAGRRLSDISTHIQERMSLLTGEMQSRKPRRPGNRVFDGNTPSLVDIHV